MEYAPHIGIVNPVKKVPVKKVEEVPVEEEKKVEEEPPKEEEKEEPEEPEPKPDLPNFKDLIQLYAEEVIADFSQCYTQDDREIPYDDFQFLLLNSFYKVEPLAELFKDRRVKFVDIIMSTIKKNDNDCVNFDDVIQKNIKDMDLSILAPQFNKITTGLIIDENGVPNFKNEQNNKIYEFLI